jgi:hypothetical protein
MKLALTGNNIFAAYSKYLLVLRLKKAVLKFKNDCIPAENSVSKKLTTISHQRVLS